MCTYVCASVEAFVELVLSSTFMCVELVLNSDHHACEQVPSLLSHLIGPLPYPLRPAKVILPIPLYFHVNKSMSELESSFLFFYQGDKDLLS